MKMAFTRSMTKILAFPHTLGAFVRDHKGTAGVEFAIIAPLLIAAYLGSFEISVGFSVARKVARASSTVADIVTQQTEVSKAYLDTMKDVTASIMTPFTQAGFTLRITGIKVTSAGTGTVAWSRDQAGGTPYAKGSTATIPTDLSTANAFIVRSELTVPYNLMIFESSMKSKANAINISKTYYFRQRVGEEITCKDCS